MMDSMAHDLLRGAIAIGTHLGLSKRQAFCMLESRQIPAFKLGKSWYARKSTLDDFIIGLEESAMEEMNEGERHV